MNERPAERGPSGTGREYPPELVHGELCATRFGMSRPCDCGKESEPAPAEHVRLDGCGLDDCPLTAAEPRVTEAAPALPDVSQLRATLKELRDLHDEAAAVIAHFTDRPAITAEDCTEDDARWIMRYDTVCEAYRSHGYVV